MNFLLVSAVAAWLASCTFFDLRRQRVPWYLTWPPMLTALGLRILGVTIGGTAAPWWQILIIAALSFALWKKGWLGAADSRGWIALVSIGGVPLIAVSLLGAWTLLGYRRLRNKSLLTPGFPGYGLGFAVWMLTRLLFVQP